MIAMTTKSSTSVNPRRGVWLVKLISASPKRTFRRVLDSTSLLMNVDVLMPEAMQILSFKFVACKLTVSTPQILCQINYDPECDDAVLKFLTKHGFKNLQLLGRLPLKKGLPKL